MTTQLQLGDIAVDVVQKEIKNVHLSVHPPTGRVRIAAPARMSLDTVRVFAISKLDWIKQQQKKLREQEREPPREFLDRESHYVWGKRYLMEVIESDQPAQVVVQHRTLLLRVRPETGEDKRQDILDAWYREQLKVAAPKLIEKWSPLIDVCVDRIY